MNEEAEAYVVDALARAEMPNRRDHGWPSYVDTLAAIRADGGEPVDYLVDAAETMPKIARALLREVEERAALDRECARVAAQAMARSNEIERLEALVGAQEDRLLAKEEEIRKAGERYAELRGRVEQILGIGEAVRDVLPPGPRKVRVAKAVRRLAEEVADR